MFVADVRLHARRMASVGNLSLRSRAGAAVQSQVRFCSGRLRSKQRWPPSLRCSWQVQRSPELRSHRCGVRRSSRAGARRRKETSPRFWDTSTFLPEVYLSRESADLLRCFGDANGENCPHHEDCTCRAHDLSFWLGAYAGSPYVVRFIAKKQEFRKAAKLTPLPVAEA